MHKRSRHVRVVVWLPALVFAALAGAGLYRAGRHAMQNLSALLVPELQRQLGREVRVGKVRVAGMDSVVAEEIAIADGPTFRSGTLLSARRAEITVDLPGVLLHRRDLAGAISAVRIDDPELLLVRQASGQWNISSLAQAGRSGAGANAFRGRIAINGGRITLQDYTAPDGLTTIELHGLSAVLDAAGAPGLTLNASAQGGGDTLKRLTLTGRYDTAGRQAQVSADFDGASVPFWQHYRKMLPTLPARSGAASGHVEIGWQPGRPARIEGTFHSGRLVLAPPAINAPLVGAPLTVRLSGSKVELDGRGLAGTVPFSLQGGITLGPVGRSRLDLHVRAPKTAVADAQKLVRSWPATAGITFSTPVDVAAHVTGLSGDWAVNVQASAPALKVKGIVAESVRADVTYHQHHIAVHSAQAQAAGGTVRAHGDVDLSSRPAQVALAGSAEGVALARLPFLPKLEKQGSASLRFSLSGTMEHPAGTVSASGEHLAVGRLQVARANADISLAPGVAPSVRGTVSGLKMEQGSTALPMPSAVSGTLDLLPGQARIRQATATLQGKPVQVFGTASYAGALDLQASADKLDAGALARQLGYKDVAGTGSVRAHITGTTAAPHVAGDVQIASARARSVAVGSGKATFDLDASRHGTATFSLADVQSGGVSIRTVAGAAALQGTQLHLSDVVAEAPQGHLQASGTVTLDGGLDLAVKAERVDLAAAERLANLADAGKALSLTGTGTFDGRVSGRWDDPLVSGSVSVADGAARGLAFSLLRGHLAAGRQSATIDTLEIHRNNSIVALSGRLALRRGRPAVVDAHVHAQAVDLAETLKALGMPARAAGVASADVQATGTYPDIAVAGQVDVRNASYQGISAGHITGRLERRGTVTQVQQLVAQDGAARLEASGSLGANGQVDLRLWGSQVPLERLNRFTTACGALSGTAGFQGTVAGPLSDPLVQLDVSGGPISVNGYALDSVAGHLVCRDGQVDASQVVAAKGTATYKLDRLVYRPKENWLLADVSATGADLGQVAAFARSIKLPNTDAGRQMAARITALPAGMQGQLNGSFHVEGRLSSLAGSAQFSLANAVLGDARVQRFAGTAEWGAGRLQLQDAVLVANGIDLSGEVTQGPGDWLDVRVALGPSKLEALNALARALPFLGGGQSPVLAPATPGGAPVVAGDVTGTVNVSGHRSSLEGTARLAVTNATVGETRLADAGGTVRWRAGSVAVDDLAVRAAGMAVSGKLGWGAGQELGAELQLQDTDLAAVRDLVRGLSTTAAAYKVAALPPSLDGLLAGLPQPLAGRATGTLALRGKPGSLSGRIDARAVDVRLGDAAFSSVAAQGTWDPQSWDFTQLALAGDGYSLGGSAQIGPDDRVRGNLTVEKANIASLRQVLASAGLQKAVPALKTLAARAAALPSPLEGGLTGTLHLQGAMSAPQADLSLTATGVQVGGHSLPQVVADARVANGVVDIRELDVQSDAGHLQATGRVDLKGPMNLRVTGEKFALASLQSFFPAAGRDLAGDLDLTATVTGTAQAPVADAQFTVANARIAGMSFDTIQTGTVHLANGRIDLGRVDLTCGTLPGSVSGTLPYRWRPFAIATDQPINLHMSLPAVSLSTLAARAGKAVQAASGGVQAELDVTGTLHDPNMAGALSLKNGSIKLAALDDALTNVAAQVHLEGPWIVIDSFTARSQRGGTVTVTGRAPVHADPARPVDLRLGVQQLKVALRDVAGAKGAKLAGTMSGTATLNGPLSQPALRGSIEVSQGQLDLPTEQDTVQKSPLKLPINPTLDVAVAIKNGASVRRGSNLSAMVAGNIGIRGALDHPVVAGNVTVDHGDVRYAATSFKLEQGGTVSFTYDPPRPLTARLDVKADTRVMVSPENTLISTAATRRAYDVILHVTGEMPQLNVAVTSDPPDLPQYRLMAILSHTDQFEALARGEDANTVLRNQVASLVSGAVLPQVFAPIETGIAQALGLDEVTFDYGFDRPLRIDARKQILPRLYISYNRDASQAVNYPMGREEFSVTYRVYQRLFIGWRREATENKDRLVVEGSFRF